MKILPLNAAETDALREKLHEAKTPYVVRFQEMVLLSRKLENERDEAINGMSKLKALYERMDPKGFFAKKIEMILNQ